MKKTVFFLLLTTGIIAAGRFVAAQEAFFIPKNELQPRYEKLPPIALPQPKLPSAIRSRNNNTGNNGQNTRQAPIRVKKPKISHYIAVDGRYIPVYAKAETTNTPATTGEVSNTESTDNSATGNVVQNAAPAKSEITQTATSQDANNNNQAVITTDFIEDDNPQPVTVPTFADNVSNTEGINTENNSAQAVNVTAPQTGGINPDLPKYRNRYSQYVNELQIFHQSGMFPANQELDQALGKMNSNKEIVIYKN